jgi:serine protease inhibitor
MKNVFSIILLTLFSILALGSMDEEDIAAISEAGDSSVSKCDLANANTKNLNRLVLNFRISPDVKPSDQKVMEDRNHELFRAVEAVLENTELPFDTSDLSQTEFLEKSDEILELRRKYAEENYPHFQGKSATEIVEWFKQNPK